MTENKTTSTIDTTRLVAMPDTDGWAETFSDLNNKSMTLSEFETAFKGVVSADCWKILIKYEAADCWKILIKYEAADGHAIVTATECLYSADDVYRDRPFADLISSDIMRQHLIERPHSLGCQMARKRKPLEILVYMFGTQTPETRIVKFDYSPPPDRQLEDDDRPVVCRVMMFATR